MVPRIPTVAFVLLLLSASPVVAFDRLPVPGGPNGLRTVTDLPSSIPDDMLLAEVVRAWYGTREALTNQQPALRRTIEYFKSSREPLADGPPLPLTAQAWARLLDCERRCNLGTALALNRNAMLLYYGLIATDNETQRWLGAHPDLLKDLLEDGAASFAIAGPFIHVRGGAIALPGGDAMRDAWSSVVDERASAPDKFVRKLMRRDGGRLAWLYSVLSQLDEPHRRFALAEGETALAALARYAVSSAPEWTLAERPFWRTPFDFSLALAFVDLDSRGLPRGSLAFWREVFRSDDLSKWRPDDEAAPLTAAALLDMLFEQPYLARDRWEIFTLGQRLPGVDRDAADAGLMLRGARRHPALALMLERIGISSPAVVLPLHQATARLFDRDSYGFRGELGAWQGALAIVERATLTGGLDRAGAEAALSGLAALRLEDPSSELTGWFMDGFLRKLADRPRAPADADLLLLQVMTGALTPSGPKQEATFSWEDLPYSFGAPASVVDRMEQVRLAQARASLEDARIAWRIAAGADRAAAEALASRLRDAEIPTDAREIASRLDRARTERDVSPLRRAARRAAEAIVIASLPALAYAPHQAVTESPTLGADVAFRHQFVTPEDGPFARRQRPWQLAHGASIDGTGWRLQGSMLSLDLALADWYLRHHGEPASAAPMFDEGDMTALAQVAALARSSGASGLGLAEAAAAVEKGRAIAAAGSADALDRLLEEAGVDPWRRFALRVQALGSEGMADLLSYGEAWRLGGAPGLLSPHPAIDGGAHLGAAPRSLLLMEGRRSAGAIGASAVDGQLRVAMYLRARHLPDVLFGDLAAGLLADLIQSTHAARTDDFRAFAEAVRQVDDARMDEHLLALVADGTLARPSDQAHP